MKPILPINGCQAPIIKRLFYLYAHHSLRIYYLASQVKDFDKIESISQQRNNASCRLNHAKSVKKLAISSLLHQLPHASTPTKSRSTQHLSLECRAEISKSTSGSTPTKRKLNFYDNNNEDVPASKKAAIEKKNSCLSFPAMSLKLNLSDFEEGENFFVMQKRSTCVVCKKHTATYCLCCYQCIFILNQNNNPNRRVKVLSANVRGKEMCFHNTYQLVWHDKAITQKFMEMKI